MNMHSNAKTQSPATGIFAPLASLLRSRGSSAPARRLAAASIGAAAMLLLLAAPAFAAEATKPWWHLASGTRPAVLAPEAKGEVFLTAANLGDAPTDGTPVTIEDVLPAGLKALSVKAIPGSKLTEIGTVTCPTAKKLKEGAPLRCVFEGALPSYDQIELEISVQAEAGVESLGTSEISVSGGGAPAAQLSRKLNLGPAAGFGTETYELTPEEAGGETATQAGSHPFQLTTSFALNQNGEFAPVQLAKDVRFHWPAGLLGNPSPIPVCTIGQFLTFFTEGNEVVNSCPAQSAVGVVVVTVNEPGGNFGVPGPAALTAPIFNLEPGFGQPARFGFFVSVGAVPVLIEPALRQGIHNGVSEDFGIDVATTNISQTVDFLSAQATVWGVPGDPAHDAARGWSCLAAARGLPANRPCSSIDESHPPAFLTLPTSCTGAPLQTSVSLDSWADPQSVLTQPPTLAMPALDGCNRLPFAPEVRSEPTSAAATTGTGLKFDLEFEDEGLTNAEGEAESQLKKTVVTLPEGFTSNPSVAEGLKACSQREYEEATVEAGTGCNGESKVGEVEVESPLVAGKKVTGGLFVAKQGENPNHNLLTLYLIARNEELGVLVRQALKVTPNPVTGQLTTEVDNVPQLPFSRFHLQFRSGQRSPLITPPACGTYAVKAQLYPYSEPNNPVERESAFQITQGPEGQPCPTGGTPPFHPTLEAGTTNNFAGSYSPFYTRISRKDSEQEITHFSIKLPPGVIGKLAGVSKCSDGAIAAAKAREHEGGGEEELQNPSCPAGSEIGHTLVGTGVGNVLAYAPGKLYLAGPYHGAPISIVSITAAKVGPFDLGTVVVREALKVNPETAQVSAEGAGSDPIPHLVDGIPVHLRDIRIYVDRPNFVLNPTSCARTSTASTVLGSGLDFASEADDVPVTVTSPFQAADCASLGFKPKLALQVSGPTHRGGVPKFKATLTYPKGGNYANIAKSVLTLPFSEILEQGHIGTSCTRVQFNEGGGNGEHCPAASVYGRARATTPLLSEPLEGPVYLRSNGGERNLPDLVAALHGEDLNVDLVGFIDAVQKKGSERSRIRNTFAAVPDAPVEKFTLEMLGGKKGLLVNTTNICKGTNRAVSVFTGQNGKLYETKPKVVASGCGKKGKGSKKHKHRR